MPKLEIWRLSHSTVKLQSKDAKVGLQTTTSRGGMRGRHPALSVLRVLFVGQQSMRLLQVINFDGRFDVSAEQQKEKTPMLGHAHLPTHMCQG